MLFSVRLGGLYVPVHYSAEFSLGFSYAELYWQAPPASWNPGTAVTNFSEMKRLTFWIRGKEGGEVIDLIDVGRPKGPVQDSTVVTMGPLTLTREWKKYTIDLLRMNRSSIAHPFRIVMGFFDNPHGMTVFLDEVQFER